MARKSAKDLMAEQLGGLIEKAEKEIGENRKELKKVENELLGLYALDDQLTADLRVLLDAHKAAVGKSYEEQHQLEPFDFTPLRLRCPECRRF